MKGFSFLFTSQAKTSQEVKFTYKLASLSRAEPKAYHFQKLITSKELIVDQKFRQFQVFSN